MKKWTENQQKVIDSRDKSILVSAAAGSGKTAVLVERIISKILDKAKPMDVDRLLVVTFTKAAATEMRERILAAIEQELEREPDNEHLQKQQSYIHNAKITTLHSFCLNLVKENFNELNLDPGVRVADEGEIKLLKTDVVRELLEREYEGKSPEFIDFVSQFERKNSDTELESMILNLYEKSMGYPWPEEWLDQCIKKYEFGSEEEFEKSEYFHIIGKYADGVLEEIINKYKIMCAYASEEGGPLEYQELLFGELEAMEEIYREKEYGRRSSKLNYQFDSLPRTKKGSCDEAVKKKIQKLRNNVKDVIGKLKDDLYGKSVSQSLGEVKECYPVICEYIHLVKEFIKLFQEKKMEKSIIDFNDYEHFALEILYEKQGEEYVPSKLADRIAEEFDEVMVDEYQDSNIVQEKIIYSVSKERKGVYNRFMVGDVKQSIYGFRGANPDIFIEKYYDYKLEPTGSEGQKIILDKNFRSRECVVNTTNYLFRQLMNESVGGINYDAENELNYGALFGKCEDEQIAKRISDTSELLLVNEEKGISNKELEARAIANRINELVNPKNGMMVFDGKSGEYRCARYRDIVILLRSTSEIGEIILEELNRDGIPCYLEQKTGYFKSMEITTLMNYLRIIDNPVQDIPLAASMVSPIGGFTDENLAVIRAFSEKNKSLYENVKEYIKFNQEDESSQCQELFDSGLREKLEIFVNRLNMFRMKNRYMTIYELLSEVIKTTGYGEYVNAMPAGSQRSANIEMLKNKAIDYEKTSYKGLFNFVRYIEKLEKYEIDMGGATDISENDDVVRIMTVHKSKGLEFPIVILANTTKKFNDMDLKNNVICHGKLGVGMSYLDEKTRVIKSNIIKNSIKTKMRQELAEEEMRLFYVACTRAKEKLIFVASGINDNKIMEATEQIYNPNEFLGYGVVVKCNSFYDFYSKAIGRNKVFLQYVSEMGMEVLKTASDVSDRDCSVEINNISISEILNQEIEKRVDEVNTKDTLLNLPTEYSYDDEMKRMVLYNLNYRYPFLEQTVKKAKMSVSDIKKHSYDEEETKLNIIPEKVVDEEIIIPDNFSVNEDERKSDYREESGLVPEFLRGEKVITAAEKGTAYHSVFEHFDFKLDNSIEAIEKFLDSLVSREILTAGEKEVISVRDVLMFSQSSLGKRMKAASERGELFREKQFVMGLSEEMTEEFEKIAEFVRKQSVYEKPQDKKQGDMVLIQGIVDVCFIENGKIVIADYKTDNLFSLEKLKKHYYVQLELYKYAMEKITGMKVSEVILYSVKLGKQISW